MHVHHVHPLMRMACAILSTAERVNGTPTPSRSSPTRTPHMRAHPVPSSHVHGTRTARAGTPVPLSYSRHTSRFFSVYTFTLPLALCDSLNLWLLPPAVAIVSWVIYATEEIGHIIENPFGAGLGEGRSPILIT